VTEHHRIVFTPSGKRGDFAEGTSVLEAARALGVDVDSVCGGRGICGRCQVLVAEGDFAKHGIQSTADHLTEWNSVEERYTSKRGALGEHRRLGCQAKLCGDIVIDVPPESQVHRQVVRKRPRLGRLRLSQLCAFILSKWLSLILIVLHRIIRVLLKRSRHSGILMRQCPIWRCCVACKRRFARANGKSPSPFAKATILSRFIRA